MNSFLSKPNVRVTLHLIAQIFAQTAVADLIPGGIYQKVFSALVAIIGVFIAFSDQSISKIQGNA